MFKKKTETPVEPEILDVQGVLNFTDDLSLEFIQQDIGLKEKEDLKSLKVWPHKRYFNVGVYYGYSHNNDAAPAFLLGVGEYLKKHTPPIFKLRLMSPTLDQSVIDNYVLLDQYVMSCVPETTNVFIWVANPSEECLGWVEKWITAHKVVHIKFALIPEDVTVPSSLYAALKAKTSEVLVAEFLSRFSKVTAAVLDAMTAEQTSVQLLRIQDIKVEEDHKAALMRAQEHEALPRGIQVFVESKNDYLKVEVPPPPK